MLNAACSLNLHYGYLAYNSAWPTYRSNLTATLPPHIAAAKRLAQICCTKLPDVTQQNGL